MILYKIKHICIGYVIYVYMLYMRKSIYEMYLFVFFK